jgi:thiol peroxidase
MEHKVTLERSPLTLQGRSIRTGMRAPDFNAINMELEQKSLSDYGETLKLIFFYPSIDHPICDLQVREMNRRAAELPENVCGIGISRDIPFALKRFSETFDIRNIDLISDYRYGSFGLNYGVLIHELNLLTRGTIILDSSNILRYRQLVAELTHQPDFDDIFNGLDDVLRNPVYDNSHAEAGQSSAYEDAAAPLSHDTVASLMQRIPDWGVVGNETITKSFVFETFDDAKSFLDILAAVSQEQNHHPGFVLDYNRLEVSLTTHGAKGLTEKDFIMAQIFDQIVFP